MITFLLLLLALVGLFALSDWISRKTEPKRKLEAVNLSPEPNPSPTNTNAD